MHSSFKNPKVPIPNKKPLKKKRGNSLASKQAAMTLMPKKSSAER